MDLAQRDASPNKLRIKQLSEKLGFLQVWQRDPQPIGPSPSHLTPYRAMKYIYYPTPALALL